jgi:hypothetical protein
MRSSQLFNLAAYALVLGLGIAALALGGGVRRVEAEIPAWPPGLVSASPPSLTAGQTSSASLTLGGAMRVVIDTPGGTDVDVTQPQPVIPYQSSSLTTAQVSCPSTAGGGVALASNSSAKHRTLINRSAVAIFVGPPAVSATVGVGIPAGAIAIDPFPGYTGELDCIVATSSQTLDVAQQQ